MADVASTTVKTMSSSVDPLGERLDRAGDVEVAVGREPQPQDRGDRPAEEDDQERERRRRQEQRRAAAEDA